MQFPLFFPSDFCTLRMPLVRWWVHFPKLLFIYSGPWLGKLGHSIQQEREKFLAKCTNLAGLGGSGLVWSVQQVFLEDALAFTNTALLSQIHILRAFLSKIFHRCPEFQKYFNAFEDAAANVLSRQMGCQLTRKCTRRREKGIKTGKRMRHP